VCVCVCVIEVGCLGDQNHGTTLVMHDLRTSQADIIRVQQI